ncbi:cation acetate symporter [Geoalkalibacter halelectricus]|uniref:Cation acetate symporter n=1 Tax=Geoalkalibacter halelectricus TaxID=2847045 RepID=A0ABY5ZLS9_9BACT|nr:cation acetate symporter [Geoalkalibacter halelectricus]MDO3378888.1 cation acetate symporter [Geoalkalibacter halelectricus]UWZ79809.1 cation acetate symporter [Geoalkalibacter halelectricus]
MIYAQSPLAIGLFISFVLLVLGLSFYLGRRTTSSDGYYAAGGNVHWFTNGIAFAGDYLSAASFLGICGMIAVSGYDGWMYSVGYLAGWMVALFLVAEPMKRLGKYTFTDALDSKFNSKSIQLMAAVSTLVVSVFYLIPQMVGAGTLVTPLLGLPHYAGVIIVGIVVTIIVATAGMASTTMVQFLKGGMLLIFSTVLVVGVLVRGFSATPENDGKAYHEFITLQATVAADGQLVLGDPSYTVPANWRDSAFAEAGMVKLVKDGIDTIWYLQADGQGGYLLEETLFQVQLADGTRLYNGAPASEGRFFPVGHMKEINMGGETVLQTGAVGPLAYLRTLQDSTIVLWGTKHVRTAEGYYSIYYQKPTPGTQILRPGLRFTVDNATAGEKFNFFSLMLALFCGTAALPHILIRYYTVPSQAAARKSTLVAIAAIGFFYILTLFMGLGAMTSGVINIMDNNMSAPLLALSFGVILFAIISSIAFATVLGTVSGLIVASSGAVAHDLLDNFFGLKMRDKTKVLAGKISAVVVGIIAIYLGIVFEGMNVSFLVGWAFAIAASANLPAILMLLFWKRTTAQGVAASIGVGIVSALGLILLSPDMYVRYGLLPSDAPISFNSPAAISIPLSFLALVVVSLMTKRVEVSEEAVEGASA